MDPRLESLTSQLFIHGGANTGVGNDTTPQATDEGKFVGVDYDYPDTDAVEAPRSSDATVDRLIDKALASRRPETRRMTRMTDSGRLELFNRAMGHGDFANKCIKYEPSNQDVNLATSAPQMTAQHTTVGGDFELTGGSSIHREEHDSEGIFMKARQGASATAPSYEDACQLLQLSEERPTLNIPGHPRPTVLKPWQVTGAAWMVLRERSPIRGGILGDSCGTGKTLTALALVHQAPLLQQDATDGTQAYKPTLILCPPLLIQTWVDEISTHLRNALNVYVFSRDKIDKRRSVNIVETFNDLTELMGTIDTQHIRAARTIILASYDRWSYHTMTNTSTAEDSEEHRIHDSAAKPKKRPKRTTKTKIYMTTFNGRFHRVIMDEAHLVKTIGTLRYQSVAKLKANHYWFITTTPMINQVVDICGYADILYRDEFAIPTGKLCNLLEEYKNWSTRKDLEQNPPLHLIAPRCISALAENGHFSALHGMDVLPMLLKLLCLTRNVDDKVKGPGGTKTIGDGIPPMHIMTCELQFSHTVQESHDATYFLDLIDNLHSGTVEHLGDIQESSGRMNMGISRRLAHLGFSPMVEMCIRNAGQATSLWETLNRHIADNDVGFHLFWKWSNPGSTDACPSEPAERAWYLLRDCPKLRYIFKILQSLGFCSIEGTTRLSLRVMILCQWSTVLWVLEMFMSFIGIPYVAIRSSVSMGDRMAALNNFTSRTSTPGPLVLLTNYHYGAFGLNVQSACPNMILVEQPQNTNFVINAIGRVHRMGQRERQRVWILFQDHTIDRYLAFANTRKIVPQIAATLPKIRLGGCDAMIVDERSKTDAWETEIQEYAEKRLMEMFGQVHSRLSMGNTKNLGLTGDIVGPLTTRKRKLVSDESEASKRRKDDEDSVEEHIMELNG